MEKLQNAAGFGFDDGFHDLLPTAIQDGDHNRFLVHIHSDIFDLVTHLSCLLGGKVLRVNVHLSPKVKCHPSADLPMPTCICFPPHTPLQVLSLAAVAERSPTQRSGGGATSSPVLLKRALFHNALTRRKGRN